MTVEGRQWGVGEWQGFQPESPLESPQAIVHNHIIARRAEAKQFWKGGHGLKITSFLPMSLTFRSLLLITSKLKYVCGQ
jgi:hypothetical protein